jgi:hypothetical protein
VYGDLDQSGFHGNSFQCLNSFLFLLDVFTEEQAIQSAPCAVFKSHKQQVVTEEAGRFNEPNTVDELGWKKSTYDRLSH